MKLWSSTILFLPVLLGCQPQKSPTVGGRDTSFTVQSTATKIQKQFPFTQIADPPVPNGARVYENLVYSTVGKRDLRLDIIVPAAGVHKLHPAVVLIHGGGWRSGDRSQTIPMARRIAGSGYVAVAVEYRLSPEALYPAAVHDLKASIRWLRAHAAR